MIHVEQHGPVLAIRMARKFLGRPLTWTTAYWVDGLLIDTGPRCTAHELAEVLKQVHVDRIVITHSHEDNIGGLHAVHTRFPKAAVYASYRALSTIQEPSQLHLQLYRRLVWGAPKGIDRVLPVEDLNNVVETPEYRFRVIETPGHSRDHISLYESTQRWVFTGDAFIGGADRNWLREADLFSMLGTLQTLASLRPERLFPSSGEVRRNPQPEIAEKVSVLLQLCRDVAQLDAAGMSVEEMVTYLFKTESPLRLWTNGHFSSANLVEACRSYNSLMAPANDPQSARQAVHPAGETASNASGSSANESADRGDVVR